MIAPFFFCKTRSRTHILWNFHRSVKDWSMDFLNLDVGLRDDAQLFPILRKIKVMHWFQKILNNKFGGKSIEPTTSGLAPHGKRQGPREGARISFIDDIHGSTTSAGGGEKSLPKTQQQRQKNASRRNYLTTTTF
jgi:hypothetical protein